jgi:pyruvate kinase
VDYLALSFVRTARDVQGLKRLIARTGKEAPVIAKIETPEALENIDDIIQAADAIMVARGDLGIELPAERVPLVQRELIRIARHHHRAVIVATQMLESMIDHSRPTRAEVGDVANAALTGADAVMLSAETASGRYPLRAVQMMDRVLREMEGYQWQQGSFGAGDDPDVLNLRDGVAHAAATLAQELKLQGIVIPTEGGTTARVISSHRPTAPLVAVAMEEAVARRLALYWGIVPMTMAAGDFQDWARLCRNVAKRCQLTRTGHHVLLVSGFNDNLALNEPTLKIMRV